MTLADTSWSGSAPSPWSASGQGGPGISVNAAEFPPASSPEPAEQDVAGAVLDVCRRAREASRTLARLPRSRKDAVLLAIAESLEVNVARIIEANSQDLERGRQEGLNDGLIDRLRLDEPRISAIAEAVRHVASLSDPVGEVMRGQVLPNGLRLTQQRVPLGVVGIVYESRPNVTVDAAALALKSGNAVVLRGGSAAATTNTMLVEVIRRVLREQQLPVDAVSGIDTYGREGVDHLMRARGLVDVLIPRGGAGLIAAVVANATVPVIETGTGNCHVYIDAAADLDQALAITLNAKTRRTSVCNAAETLLVHREVARWFLPQVLPALAERGIRLHVDEATAGFADQIGVATTAATEEDWASEYLDSDLAVAVVPDLTGALDHIRRYSSGHTEAIVTTDMKTAQTFVTDVDSAVVAVNASTAFTDGGEFGLGAEIGISTQKLHARGPMGLAELTSSKWVVVGDGHTRD